MSISTDYSYYKSTYHTQQAARRQKPSLMSLMDSNEDKTLGADELENFAAEFNEKTGNTLDVSSIMSKYDANGDGELDESEQKAMNKEKALERLVASGMPAKMRMMDEPPPPFSSEVDQDGDGSWNSDELTQFIDMVNESTGSSLDLESVLQKYDTDGDGSLSKSEQTEMFKDMAPPPPPQKSSEISSEDDEDEKIREKIEELRKLIEEKFAKKEEEKALTEDIVSKKEAMNFAFMNRLSQTIGTYEKFFWFENKVGEGTQYEA